MAMAEYEQVEDIHGFDSFKHPCVDLTNAGDLTNDEVYNNWIASPEGQAMHQFMDKLTEKPVTPEDMKGTIHLIQDFQKDPELVAGTNGLKVEIVSAAELQQIEIKEPGWWEKGFDATKDGLKNWKDGIKQKFDDAVSGVKETAAEVTHEIGEAVPTNADDLDLNDSGVLKDLAERNQNMDEMMAETSDTPQPPGMSM